LSAQPFASVKEEWLQSIRPLGSILSSFTFVSIKYRGGEKEEEKRKRERKFGKR
jgi:hypothetical protein